MREGKKRVKTPIFLEGLSTRLTAESGADPMGGLPGARELHQVNSGCKPAGMYRRKLAMQGAAQQNLRQWCEE